MFYNKQDFTERLKFLKASNCEIYRSYKKSKIDKYCKSLKKARSNKNIFIRSFLVRTYYNFYKNSPKYVKS